MKKISFFAGLAFFLFACQNNPSAPQTHSNEETDHADTTIVDTSSFFLQKYQGTIGDRPATMTLTDWGDGFLSGWLALGDSPVRLLLSGEMTGDHQFEISALAGEEEIAQMPGTMHSQSHLSGQWLPASGAAPTPFDMQAMPQIPDDNWSGKWFLNEIWDGGLLMTGHYSEDSLDFALSIFRGGHTGIAEGRAAIQGTKAVFFTNEFDPEPGCRLLFEHHGDYIEIIQEGSNFGCGFGMRASANGKYERTKKVIHATLDYDPSGEKIFKNQAQHDAFKKLVGEEMYDLFAYNMQVVEPAEILPGDDFATRAVEGFVQGMLAYNEAIIMRDDAGKFWAATIDLDHKTGEMVVRYFTNDPARKDRLPATIEEWRDNFLDYRVVFENPDL
ncbi:MAG: hypothetical protein D6714_07455 [Bacteroidetes bacterium]|nr:MAG: hypothetical protein D6714_07455 [Bacteroidota bacterium]